MSEELSSSTYSGLDHGLVLGHDQYSIGRPARPAEKRRHLRIPCRSLKAGIKIAAAPDIIVDVLNMSRSGVCFVSAEHFFQGTEAAIAMHYVEGGQNIFQDCRIVRARHNASGSLTNEYGIEFSIC